ncbi:unnamed protein product [Rotaria sp. Silwood1]|nr:unnamed protein product [Rotaria sp. Silwood1]
MSATLDTELLYNYFSKGFRNLCGKLEIGGHAYSIEDTYLDDDVENYVQASVAKAVAIHRSEAIGDILVFLTGQEEIDLAINELNQKLVNNKPYKALPLHGKLFEDEIKDIFEKIPNKRIDNIESFQWLEPPCASNLQEANQTLIWLNALDDQDKLTDLGQNMAHLSIDPKLTAMLYKAKELQCLSQILIIAGMLTVSQNIWWRGKGHEAKRMAIAARRNFSHESGDHMTLLIVYWQWRDFGDDKKKEQYDWCRNHFVNAKSLKLANDFIEEISKQMDHEMTIDKDLNQDLIHRILQCLTAGFFQHLAVSNGPLRAGYRVISAFSSTSTKPLIARVSQMSALSINDQMPQYILYNELVNLNGINYITTLSKLDPDWLHSVSQQWQDTVQISCLHRIAYESFTFTEFTVAVIRAVVGKRNCKLNMINEAIQGVIEANYNDTELTIWCQKSNLDSAKKTIKDMAEKEKQKLSDEQEEIQIVVRGISFLQQTSNGVCAAVTYTTPNQAHNALKQLNCHIEENRRITVGGSYLKSDALIGKQDSSLKAIWYLTPSLGNGKIIFTDKNNALNAYRFLKNSYYHCRYEGPDDLPEIEIIYYRGSIIRGEVKFQTKEQMQAAVQQMKDKKMGSTKLTYARGQDAKDVPFIKVTGLPTEADEEDIRNHFQSCAGVVDVIVVRKPNSKKFDIENAKDQIRELFKEYKSFQDDSINIKNFPQETTIAYATFADEDELRLAIHTMNGKTDCIGCGKVRLSGHVKKKKQNEYAVRLQVLDQSVDKYDIIKILKQNQLYNYAKNIIVYRQKLKKDTMAITTQEQEIGLAALRKKFGDNKDFHSTPTYHIYPPTSDGVVTASVFFDNPVDVATAIQAYNNTKIQLSKSASNLRLIPSMAHEILVHSALAKAIPNQIREAIKCIKKEFHNKVYIKFETSETDIAKMKITVDGDDIEQIKMAKIKFENIMKGTEYIIKDDPEKIQIIFDGTGKDVLQRIQKETGSYIWWSVPNALYCSHVQPTWYSSSHLTQYVFEQWSHVKYSECLDLRKTCS